MAQWMMAHNQQNPIYTHFEDFCDIMYQYDVTWSLGDGTPARFPGQAPTKPSSRRATLGQLTLRASWEKNNQVMIEGPGHVPMDQIPMNIERQIKECHGAPFYVLGPLVIDISPGYDHISSTPSRPPSPDSMAAAMLCYVTPKEHLGLPQ